MTHMETEHILDKIYNAALKFLVPLTPMETYNIVIEEATKLVDAQHGSVFLKKGSRFERVYTSYPPLYRVQARKRGFVYEVFKANKPRIVPITIIGKAHPELKKTFAGSDIMVPLSFENKAIGVITLLSKPGKEFSRRDLGLVQLFGPLAMLAIQNSLLHNETRESLETRDLFISMASHELKTPLTTVYAYMQLMQQKMEKKEKLKLDWVNTLLHEVQRLTDLVNELLQINQIQTGRLQYNMREINLADVVSQFAESYELSHKPRKIQFVTETKKQSFVIGDSDKLVQVLTNILNNASKHSPVNKPIKISLVIRNSSLLLSIQDQGEGIAKKDIPKIFNQFYKGKNHKKEGMGLGLYLTKNIIEEHKGQISIDSKLKKGTTVIIKLPLAI